MVHFFHVGSFCLFAALVLLVIICVSAPVWHDVYFLKANINSNTSLRLGMWGTCVEQGGKVACSDKHLGYKLGDAIETYAGASAGGDLTNLGDSVIHGLTFALVLHPIAAGITFLAFIFAICNNRVSFILGSLVAFFAFLVQLVAFCIDLGLFVTAHHRINDALGSGTSKYGNALWMSLVATILLLLGSFTVCCERVRSNRASRRSIESGNASPVARRRFNFWNRN